MSIIAWIVLGLVAGLIAKALHPGPDPGGFILTIIIGIVGALIAFADDQGDCSAERQFAEVNEERRVCHSDCRFVETVGMPVFRNIDHHKDNGYRAAENN